MESPESAQKNYDNDNYSITDMCCLHVLYPTNVCFECHCRAIVQTFHMYIVSFTEAQLAKAVQHEQGGKNLCETTLLSTCTD